MNLFEDNYKSMYEPFELPQHPFDDSRAASHSFEDEWCEGGNQLLNSVLFSVPEIFNLFVK